MVDFKKLVGKSPERDYSDPIVIHKNLDAEVSHSHLRDVQREALEGFRAERSSRDIVLKMSTGSGKTTVGLLMLKSYMAETHQPGVYLCPTRQLVQQVVSEAKRLGLKAESYTDPHPAAAAIGHRRALAWRAAARTCATSGSCVGGLKPAHASAGRRVGCLAHLCRLSLLSAPFVRVDTVPATTACAWSVTLTC